MLIDYKLRVMETRGCPRCGVNRGERCYSTLLRARMVNQIHEERIRAELAQIAGDRR